MTYFIDKLSPKKTIGAEPKQMMIQLCLCESCRNLASSPIVKGKKKSSVGSGLERKRSTSCCAAVAQGLHPANFRSLDRASSRRNVDECPSLSVINMYNPEPTVITFAQFSELMKGKRYPTNLSTFEDLEDLIRDEAYAFTTDHLSLLLVATSGKDSKRNTKDKNDIKTGKFILIPTRYLNIYAFLKQYVK